MPIQSVRSPCPEGHILLSLLLYLVRDKKSIKNYRKIRKIATNIRAGIPRPTAKFRDRLSLRVKAAPARIKSPRLVKTPPTTAVHNTTVSRLNLCSRIGNIIVNIQPIAAPEKIPTHCRPHFFISLLEEPISCFPTSKTYHFNKTRSIPLTFT